MIAENGNGHRQIEEAVDEKVESSCRPIGNTRRRVEHQIVYEIVTTHEFWIKYNRFEEHNDNKEKDSSLFFEIKKIKTLQCSIQMLKLYWKLTFTKSVQEEKEL